MDIDKNNRFSQTVSIFHGRVLPEPDAELAGYAVLIATYDLKCPLPFKLAAISSQHKRYETNQWAIYTPRYKPNETLSSQLTFALKYEGIDLAILKALFLKIDQREIEEWLKSEPMGVYSRRIWFLYEWLMDKALNLPDLKTGNFVDILDPKQYYGGSPEVSKRHRVRDNLPGVPDFCPLVRRTEKLDRFIGLHLDIIAKKETISIQPDVLARAAAFLMIKDSRASFEIEGENPEEKRAESWARAIGQAGINHLSVKELIRLQSIVLEGQRFIPLGLRKEGGFIGGRERPSGRPVPDHISARAEDLPQLMQGMISVYERLKTGPMHPVLSAALIAFGFVYIHPFVDGNGRIHRYLIHHILAEMGFTPKEVVFPVSAVILDSLDEYRKVLESYSRPRLEFVDWQSTTKGNVEVLNNTQDLYRYFDATREAEYLFECVKQIIEKILPEEISYLEKYDRLKREIEGIVDMPNHLTTLLIHFLDQNHGVLSKRAREKEFKALTEAEVKQIEELYERIFIDYSK